MRRYFLYFAVGLVAFGIGVFSASVKLPQKNELKPETFHNLEVNKSSFAQTVRSEVKETYDTRLKEKLTCSDETLKLVWSHLKKEVTSTFGDEQGGDCTRFFTVKKIDDLNNDGGKEIFIQSFGPGFCGATGNCQLYVFSQKRNSYKIILTADMTQRFNIKTSKSNNYFDIETLSHGSMSSGELTVYEFGGRQYKAEKCFDYEYRDENDASVLLDEPNLIRKKCWINGQRNY